MVATVSVMVDYGGSDGNPQTQDTMGNEPSIRFKTLDNNDMSANGKLLGTIDVPASGTNNSFWKHIYLKVTGGSFTRIENIKFYTDGSSFGSGVTTYIGTELPTHNSGDSSGYTKATGTDNVGGDDLLDHDSINTKNNVFTFTSGTPKNITISESDNVISNVGESTDYIVAQMEVSTSVSLKGDLTDKTWYFIFDEL
tara:strand:+ start:5568 stop:6158 length:591 start_codon:yes stop_codon:yes gene_type:complete